jgi:hypothetical protein
VRFILGNMKLQSKKLPSKKLPSKKYRRLCYDSFSLISNDARPVVESLKSSQEGSSVPLARI